jgi:DNA-binding MarR family transcriptional regulator
VLEKNVSNIVQSVFSQESAESLLHKLVYLMGQSANKSLIEKVNVNFTQFRILMQLNYNPSSNQKNLADCIGMTEGGLSKAILDLEEKKIIISSINPENRRERQLHLTPAGRLLFNKSATELSNMSKELFSVLSHHEQTNFTHSLQKLIQQSKQS